MKNFTLRTMLVVALVIICGAFSTVSAQLLYQENHLFVGPMPQYGTNVGVATNLIVGQKFGIEHNLGGLNFYILFPESNWGDYKLFISESGKVGIGRAPASYALEVNGQVWTTGGLLITSDGTLKKNIINIGDNRTEYLRKLLKLNGKLYDKQISSSAGNAEEVKRMVEAGKIRKEDAEAALKSLNESQKDVYKKEFGFIAQEVKEQFPELAEENADGIYAVNYTGLIPVLLEAIKELNAKVENLEKQLVTTKQDVSTRSGSTTKNGSNAENGNILETTEYLSQNIPNPFTGTTTIKYSLPEGTTSAAITVYSTSGTVVKTVPLNVNNKSGSITLSSSEFTAGIYVYNLTANGAVLASKKMINQ
jgi:hypothetical protein